MNAGTTINLEVLPSEKEEGAATQQYMCNVNNVYLWR